MKHYVGFLALAVFLAGCVGQQSSTTIEPKPDANATTGTMPVATTVTFADVQPILQAKCVGCHGAKAPEGIDLRSYAAVMKGGEHGAIVEPGKAANSDIVKALRETDPKKRMPLNAPALSDDEIGKIEAWINGGAKA